MGVDFIFLLLEALPSVSDVRAGENVSKAKYFTIF